MNTSTSPILPSAPAAALSSTEERALKLLGSGISQEVVASSLGVSPSYISQLLSEESFAARVSELRFQNLAKHNERDDSYDSLEDSLVGKLRDALPLMYKPLEILRAIQVINGAKRRGASTPESIIEKQQIVQLTMPTKIIQNFQTNITNQVIHTGEQSLLTMQSGTLAERLKNDSLLPSKETAEPAAAV